MRKLMFTIVILLPVFLLQNCAEQPGNTSEFEKGVTEIRQKYAPDLSLNVLETRLEKESGEWQLSGETTVEPARKEIIALADSIIGEGKYRNEFRLLPLESLGDSTFAIVTVSTAHLREEPRHSAQLVDQNIMGNTLRLLKNDGGWYLVQTEYDYIGWMRRESFVRTDSDGVKRWENSRRVRVTDLYPMVYSRKSERSEPVSDVVLNATLGLKGKSGGWTEVALPDGRSGFIRSEWVTSEILPQPPKNKLDASLIKTARSMMGIPYLWGGNSSKGNDCSGFTQTVFKTNGIQLPRDARQQARIGDEVEPDQDYSNIRPGDLLFFGSQDRITHVGISLGGPEFIHQSGIVHINSLNPEAPNFSPYRKRTLQRIKRVF